MTTTEQASFAGQAIIETAKEIILMGATAQEVFEILSNLIGNKGARLVLANIGLDAGLKEETKKYLASF